MLPAEIEAVLHWITTEPDVERWRIGIRCDGGETVTEVTLTFRNPEQASLVISFAETPEGRDCVIRFQPEAAPA
jgi:hypothetical protein